MSIETSTAQESLIKLKELVNQIDIGMLGTYPQSSDYIHAVPMSRQEIDAEGNIWFLFSSDSDTFQHLQDCKLVSLLYADVGNYSFLSINGTAEISQDDRRVEKYWSKMTEGWFDEGKDDPRIRVLKITPIEAHYWDTKSNKLVTLLKGLTRGITGAKLDMGEEGDLKI